MQFKGLSYLELWQPFCSAEHNHLCNFGRRYQEEQFCEIILNLGQWFRRCLLKKFLSGALQRSITICVILVEGIKRNNSVNFEFESVIQKEMSFKKILIWSSGDPPVQWSGTIYAILKEGIMGNIHVKLYEIRTSGSGGCRLKKKLTDGRTTTNGRQTKNDINTSP